MSFRVNRKKFFLTYSACPTSSDWKEDLKSFLESKGPISTYSIGREVHKEPEDPEKATHYHAYVEFDDTFQSADARVFDFNDIHPNILTGKPGRHIKYSQKFGDFIANEVLNHWKHAVSLKRSCDAIDYLWENCTSDMAKTGHLIERNLRRKMDIATVKDRRWTGPFMQIPYYENWDQYTKTLVIVGPPRQGKTQFAKYLADHLGKKWVYVKNSIEGVKHVWKPGTELIIWDDIFVEKYQDAGRKDWSDLFDVNEGGSIHMRNKDFECPPGVWKIWICNQDRWDLLADPGGRVKGGGRDFVYHFQNGPICIEK